MNTIVDDYGRTVLAVGAPASIERVKIEYPKLIDSLNGLYNSAYGSYGRGIDEAIQKIRDRGIKSEMETKSILMASNYAKEPQGSVTSLVTNMAAECSCSDGPYHYSTCHLYTGNDPFSELGKRLSTQPQEAAR